MQISHYHADADEICESCAVALYGPDDDDRDDGTRRTDHEGNPVHPIFDTDVSNCLGDHGLVSCGNCRTILEQWCDHCEQDDHGTIQHGEPLVLLEHGRRSHYQEPRDRIAEALSVISSDRDRIVPAVYSAVDAQLRAISAGLDRFGPDDDDDGLSIDVLDEISDMLGDAGYLAFDHGDAGAWFVLRPWDGPLSPARDNLRRYAGEWCMITLDPTHPARDYGPRRMMPRHPADDGKWRYTDAATGTEWFMAQWEVASIVRDDEGEGQ